MVDDFGVKYVGEEHANHLKQALDEHYKLTCDWTGTRYIGITLDWNYTNRQVHLSMLNYVMKALKKFQLIAKKTSICTVPMRPNSVWHQEAIRNAGIKSTIIRGQGQTIHPTGMRQMLGFI